MTLRLRSRRIKSRRHTSGPSVNIHRTSHLRNVIDVIDADMAVGLNIVNPAVPFFLLPVTDDSCETYRCEHVCCFSGTAVFRSQLDKGHSISSDAYEKRLDEESILSAQWELSNEPRNADYERSGPAAQTRNAPLPVTRPSLRFLLTARPAAFCDLEVAKYCGAAPLLVLQQRGGFVLLADSL